jgi:hypothetical protein
MARDFIQGGNGIIEYLEFPAGSNAFRVVECRRKCCKMIPARYTRRALLKG